MSFAKDNPKSKVLLPARKELRDASDDVLTYALQAYGMWFQLLTITEQISNEKRLRLIETEIGHDGVPGTFAQVISQASSEKISADEIQNILNNMSISPVITAHPTEAKRVTVLEIHHRIYMLLKNLEHENLTAHDRDIIKQDVHDEVDLLWLTGEIRLEKPTVEQEIAWGMHFFRESLYEGVVKLYSELESVLGKFYPGYEFDIPAFFQFGSWVGGDRDGNPFVTNEITEYAIKKAATVTIEHYIKQIVGLGGYLSIAEHSIKLPVEFYDKYNAMLERGGDAESIKLRNPGELFRQLCHCMINRLNANLNQLSTGTKQEFAYSSVKGLARDLRIIEEGLLAVKCDSLCLNHIRPIRHSIEAFGFHTTSLDIRQNSTVTTNALQEIWKELNDSEDDDVPAKESKAWRKWLLKSLKEPMPTLPEFKSLSDMSDENTKPITYNSKPTRSS